MISTGLGMFSDMGLSSGAMRSKREDALFLNVGWILQIIRGIIITAAGAIVAVTVFYVEKFGLFSEHTVYFKSGKCRI